MVPSYQVLNCIVLHFYFNKKLMMKICTKNEGLLLYKIDSSFEKKLLHFSFEGFFLALVAFSLSTSSYVFMDFSLLLWYLRVYT